MHRSGTSLLTSILDKLGLYTGHSKDDDDNHEALLFRQLNEWLLRQANASWDNPYNFNFINSNLSDILCAALEMAIKSKRRELFLGPEHTSSYASIRDLDFPWGWKDPRNTFTIDLWGKVFPTARVLHIYRNPVDVAASLRQREITMTSHLQGLINSRGIEHMINRRTQQGTNFQLSPRVEHIEEGIKLWRQYVTKAFSLSKVYGNRCMHIKYESFLERPQEVLNLVSKFTGLAVDENIVAHSAEPINTDRCYAFTNNTELVRVYRQIKNEPLIKTLGYNDIRA